MGRKIIAAVDDMFFAAKIRATAEHLGADVQIVRSERAALDAAHAENPSLIIVDLHAQKFSPFGLAQKLKTDERAKNIPLMGFFSHVQTKLRQQAIEAGFDQVIPRSAFSKNLADILQG